MQTVKANSSKPITAKSAWSGEVLYSASLLLPLLLTWGCFLLTIWPGIMTQDSLDQWMQISLQQYHDLHPAFHTFTIWLLTRLWPTPAVVPLVQISLAGLLIIWGLRILRQAFRPYPWWGGLIVVVVMAVSPVNITTMNTLWKDVPYTLSMLCLSLLLLKTVISQGEWLQSAYAWPILGGIGSLVMLYRHNGITAVLGSLILLLLLYHRHWRPIGAALLMSIALWAGMRGPVYNWVGVNKSPHPEVQFMVHQLAAHLKAGMYMSPEEQEILASLRPLKNNWEYNCYNHSSTTLSEKFDFHHMSIIHAQIKKVYWQVSRRNPAVNLKHIRCSSMLIWSIKPPRDGPTVITRVLMEDGQIAAIAPNSLGLHTQSRLPGLQATWFDYLSRTETDWVWRPALYLYLALALTGWLAWRRKSWRLMLFVLPALIHSLTLVPINLTQEARYQYPVYLISLFALAFLFVPKATADD